MTESSVRALDIPAFRTRSLWWRRRGPPLGGDGIYIAALIFDSHATDERIFDELNEVHTAWGAASIELYDCWSTRDLGTVGYKRQFQNPWYLRLASPLAPMTSPAGLSIETATTSSQLADFETATCLDFEQTVIPARFAQHAQATLEDPGMNYLIARLEGQVVASSIAYATEDMVGIYGISTLPKFRRFGFGTALVQAAVALYPDLPISVYPDPPSVPIYTSSGFNRAKEITVWRRN